MTIGQRIKEARLAKGYTQEELAKKMGYKGKSIICKYEKNADNVTLDTVSAFAKALGVSESYIMGWDDIDWNPETQEITRDLSKCYKKNIINGKEIHPEYMAASVIGSIMITPEQKLSERKMKELEELVKILVDDEDFRDKILDYAFEIKKGKEGN